MNFDLVFAVFLFEFENNSSCLVHCCYVFGLCTLVTLFLPDNNNNNIDNRL